MEQKRNQKLLRQQFWFRLLVLISLIAGCVLYGFLNIYSLALWGIVLGVSGSALVWSFVELIDFFVKTYQQYTNERNQFFIMVENHWKQLQSIFKTQVDIINIPWEEVVTIIDDLYNTAASFPFQGCIYSISKEFETASIYITRLYWKSHGYMYSIKKENTQDYWEPFYKTFVLITSELPQKPMKTLKNLCCINNQIDALQEIDISFLDFDHPTGMIFHNNLGDLEKSISILSGEIQYKTFKPAYDFHEEFYENVPHGSFLAVMYLLFRRTKKWT